MITDLSQRIREINLVEVVTEEGMQLKPTGGGRYTSRCPFHSEQTPSFTIFPDNRFKCFGCGESGDAVDLIQKLHGLEFKDVCSHLGLEIGKPLTIRAKKEISEYKHIKELIEDFRKWERTAVHTFSILVRATYQATQNMTPEDFEKYGEILDPIPYWEHCLDILTSGDDEQKYLLFRDCQKRDMTCMKRNLLFRPSFDYKKWLRETLEK